ncbi:YveK family protein [Oceanobacillus saliphilus]|uniref:YveK family protein n=1 Tax=Oceanobacillus saliphilus TaxID=2925834 RepID=UPI00201E574A|nr:Wzz/FepE/Etk N-terminal domain-containing protein [Oceanobacillus saliphilus]
MNKTNEINLKDYFDVIKQRFWIIVVITLLTTLAGHFYSNHNYTPFYQSSTRIILGAGSEDMNTLMVLIKDPIIMENVKEELNLTRPSESIAGQIEIERIDNSQVIRISVTDRDPSLAADIVNATATSFKSEIVNILNYSEVQLLSPAKINPYPINESQNRLTIIAFIFGVTIGVGLIFLMDSLDGKVRKEREVEEILGVPVLGVVTNMNKKRFVAKRAKRKQTSVRGESVGIKQEAS